MQGNSVSTVSTVKHDTLIYYIETLRAWGIIDHSDDYEFIAECIRENYHEIVEYEDIKDYYETEDLDESGDEDMKLMYRNSVE